MYADVIPPIALSLVLSYHVPPHLEQTLRVGDLVTIPIGKSAIYRGVVVDIATREQELEQSYKDIISIDMAGVATALQIKMWQWVSSYYLATMSEVVRSFLPSPLRGKVTDVEFSEPRNGIEIVKLEYGSDEAINSLLDGLKRAKKQHSAVCRIIEKGKIEGGYITLDITFLINSGIPRAVIKELEKKSIVEITLDNNPSLYHQRHQEPEVEEPLKEAIENIVKLCELPRPVVVDGYNRWAEMLPLALAEALAEGKESATILLLLPSSTDLQHYIDTFRRYSSLYLTTYHGGMTSQARTKCYCELLTPGGRRVLLATKAAIGLPLNNLAGVIVMQEHSMLYKQGETPPCYSARDGAVMLGHIHRVPVVLFDRTPSLESMHNVAEGKYSHLSLGDAPSCRVTIIDRGSIARKERREQGVDSNTRYISNYLRDRIEQLLAEGERILIYHSRRGFSQYILCKECGDVPRCPQCNVSLTYHKERGSLECHYCSYRKPLDLTCKECGSEMVLKGVGTENIEEKLKEAFPTSKIARVDSDSKSDYSAIAAADIVVGTQLIGRHAMGSEFALTVLLNSDTLLNIPDFRATERAMAVVDSLKAMTKESGELVVQGTLDNTPYAMMIRGAYRDIYPSQITERGIFAYPPITRMVVIHLRSESREAVEFTAKALHTRLQKSLASRVSPVDIPFIEYQGGRYRRHIVVKIERELLLSKVKGHISDMITQTLLDSRSRGVRLFVDVDPSDIG